MIHEHDAQRAAGSALTQVGAYARGVTSVGGIADGGVEVTSLSIDMIRCDGGTQMRVGLNQEAVESYAEYMEDGAEFPPVVVFHDGNAYWLADGFHRVAARQRVAAKHVGTDAHKTWSVIAVDVRAGTREDAIRFAIGANKTNGLRRTNADKQVAVRAALAHPAMQEMSDSAIARESGVSQPMVSTMRRQVKNFLTSSQVANSTHKAVNTKTDIEMRTGIDGKRYPVRQRAAPIATTQKTAPNAADTESKTKKTEHTKAESNGKMTQEDVVALKQKVVDLHRGGMRISDIASSVGVDWRTAKRWTDDPDSTPSTRGYNAGVKKLDDSEVERLFNDGKSREEIAETLGVSTSTVGASLKRLGLGRAGKKARNPLVDHIANADAHASAWSFATEVIVAAASVSSTAQVKELTTALNRLSQAVATLKRRLNKDAGKDE